MDPLTLTLTAVDRASSVLQAIGATAERVFEKIEGALEAIGSTAAKVATVIGGTLVAAFVAVGKAGIDMNLTLEGARLALTKILGSADAAGGFLGALRREALTSKLEFKELVPLGQQLAAVYGPQGLGRVLPTLRAFGDAGSILAGGDKGAVGRALVQFRQVASGLLERESLKTIEENLPGSGVLDIITKRFGSADTKELTKAGVTGQMVAEAIVRGFQERFGGAQEELAGTLPVILSNFGDAWNELTAAITAKALPVLTAAAGKVLEILQGLAGNERFIQAISSVFELLAAAATRAAEALPGVVEWLSQIVTKENVIRLLSETAGWFQVIGEEVKKFLEAAAGGRSFDTLWGAFSAAGKTAIDLVYKGWNILTATIMEFSRSAPEIFGIIKDAITPVVQWLQAAVDRALILAGAFSKGFGGGGGHTSAGMGGGVGGGGFTINAGMGGGGGGHAPGNIQTWILQQIGSLLGSGAKAFLGDQLGPLGMLNNLSGMPDVGKAWQQSNIQGRATDVFNRIQAAGQAAAGGSIDDVFKRQQAAAGGIAAGLTRATATGPAGAGGTGLPPAHIMSQAGGAMKAASGFLDEKAARELLQNLNQVYDTRLAAFQVMVEGYPQEEQSARALQILGPELERQQQNLLQHMKRLQPGTEAFLKAQKELFGLQKKRLDLQQGAARDQERAEKEMERVAAQLWDKGKGDAQLNQRFDLGQTELDEARLRNNPFLTPQQRRAAQANLQEQRFRLLNRGVFGESDVDAQKRLIEAERVRGEINKTLGLESRSFRTLGGGEIQVTDPRAYGVSRYLDQVGTRGRREGYGPDSVVFAPTINASQDYDELKQVFLDMFDQMFRQAYPGQ